MRVRSILAGQVSTNISPEAAQLLVDEAAALNMPPGALASVILESGIAAQAGVRRAKELLSSGDRPRRRRRNGAPARASEPQR